MTTSVKIPQRSIYKAAEVCAIAKLQPYVLRSWETEFSDLGDEQPGGRPRVYRRADLDRVLRIKELLFVEGLTLGAARRKILRERPAADEGEQAPVEALLGADMQSRVEEVKAGLRSILAVLLEPGNGDGVSQAEPHSAVDDALPGPAPTPVSRKPARAKRASSAARKRRRKDA